MFGLFIKFIPIPTIKYSFFDFSIFSCKIPQIFFLSISKSFGFLKCNFLLQYFEIVF